MVHSEEWKKSWKKPEIKHGVLTKYNYLVLYPENLVLGNCVDISQFVYILAKGGVTIEDDAEIGPHTSIISYSSIDEKIGPVRICRKACVGAHSTVMPGVTIGENSIVGAHSFVNADIPANVVAFGVPCKVIRELK